jgi:mutator protein MutT
MDDLVTYKILKKDLETGEEFTGLDEIAFTSDPAIIVKGMAFNAQKKLVFKDEPKMRIVAPAMIPMEIYRNQDGEEFNVEFTAEQIELIHTEIMQLVSKGESLFNFEHDKSQKVPAYILEAWIVDNPETDKAKTTYGIDVPKGTLMLTTQITDRKFYDNIVANGQVGYSIGGSFGLKLSKQQSYSDVIVFNSNRKVLLLKRNVDDNFEANKWGFVGGKIEEGESPDLAAIREMKEESGIESGVSFVTKFKNQDGSITHYFKCVYDGDVSISKEHQDFGFFEVDELDSIDVILSQNSRFKEVAINAKESIKFSKQLNTNTMEVQLSEGKQYLFKDGKLVEVEVALSENPETETPVEETETEMAAEETTEETTTEETTEEATTEMAEEMPTEEAPAESITEEKVASMIEERMGEVLNMLAELKAAIEEAKQEEAVEEEEQAPVQLSAHERLAKFSASFKKQ